MTRKRLKVLEILIERSVFMLARQGCNDLKLPDDWTDEECDELDREWHEDNGDPHEHEKGLKNRYTNDFAILDLLFRQLVKEYLEKNGDEKT